jgi:hypothetical protein
LGVFGGGGSSFSLPPPNTTRIQKISDADISLICAGDKPDQFNINRWFISQSGQIDTRSQPHRQERSMSKLKLEHGVSRIRRAKLQSSIDQTVADDIELLAEWSNNETNYIVNELLRFALTQDEDFQKYKASSAANAARAAGTTKPSPTPIKPVSEPVANAATRA